MRLALNGLGKDAPCKQETSQAEDLLQWLFRENTAPTNGG